MSQMHIATERITIPSVHRMATWIESKMQPTKAGFECVHVCKTFLIVCKTIMRIIMITLKYDFNQKDLPVHIGGLGAFRAPKVKNARHSSIELIRNTSEKSRFAF